MLRWLGSSVLLVGCGFHSPAGVVDGAPGRDALTDAAGDAPGDAAKLPGDSGCYPAWRDGTIRFNGATKLDVSTGGANRDPWVSADGKTLFFTRDTGDTNGYDVYRATRGALEQPFTGAARLVELSTTRDEGRPSLTSDGAILALSTVNPGGDAQILISLRDGARYPSPDDRYTLSVNQTGKNHHDPFLSGDGLRLYLAPDPDGAGGSPQYLARSTRTSVQNAFTSPLRLAGANDAASNSADPTLSADERIIVFSSDRLGGMGNNDLWYATRDTASGDFGPAKLVPSVNGLSNDGDPMLSMDGCQLYFASTRGGSGYDIYVVDASDTAMPSP